MNKKSSNGYDSLTSISTLNFEKKSVLIIGGGEMGKQYARALTKMNIQDVTIVSKTLKIGRGKNQMNK